MEDHFKLEGDKVKILIMDNLTSDHLGKLKHNAPARVLRLHTLGAEILASMSTLYGEDDTGIYAEGTAAGLLPTKDDLGSFHRIRLFKGMHAEENHRPPELLVSRVCAIQDLIRSRGRWWNVLFRDIRDHKNGQLPLLYASAAVFIGLYFVVRTITSTWGLVLMIRSTHP